MAALVFTGKLCYANRAVMEGIAASSSTIYIDTVNVRVGISTGIPQDTLDVHGSVRVSSAVRLGSVADPGTYGFILTSSGPGLAPFWNPPTSYGYIYYLTATPSATTPFKLMTSTGQALISTDTFTAADDGVIISTFITPSNQPGITSIPSGRYVAHVHAARTAGTKDVYISAQVWEYTSTGGVVGMIGQTGLVGPITSSNLAYDSIWTSGSEYVLASTSSRIAVKIKLTVSGGGSAPDVAVYYGDDTDSHIAFPANSANLSGYVLKSGDTMTGALTVTGTSVTASAFFGDGSHLTGIGTSGAQLASTQTFSGANTFLSTVTVGTSSAPWNVTSSTLNYAAAVIGGWFDCGAIDVNAATAIEFYGFFSTYTYRRHWNLTQNTSNGSVQTNINDDVGSNYQYSNVGNYTNNVACTGSSGGTTSAQFNCGVDNKSATIFSGNTDISATPDFSRSSTIVMETGTFQGNDTGATRYVATGGAYYSGSASIANYRMTASAGTITGRVWFECHINKP